MSIEDDDPNFDSSDQNCDLHHVMADCSIIDDDYYLVREEEVYVEDWDYVNRMIAAVRQRWKERRYHPHQNRRHIDCQISRLVSGRPAPRLQHALKTGTELLEERRHSFSILGME